MYLLLGYGHVTEELSELNGSCDSWVHVRVESGLFANEIEKSSLEIQYRRLKSLTPCFCSFHRIKILNINFNTCIVHSNSNKLILVCIDGSL